MNITWEMYDSMISRLYHRIWNQGYDIIIGVTRGGLVPAVHLSHLLGLPMGMVQYQLRDGDGKMHTVSQHQYKKPLIVDDICDSGATIKGLSGIFKNADFAVLLDKTGSDMIKYRGEYFESDEWVIFPWEL